MKVRVLSSSGQGVEEEVDEVAAAVVAVVVAGGLRAVRFQVSPCKLRRGILNSNHLKEGEQREGITHHTSTSHSKKRTETPRMLLRTCRVRCTVT